MLTKEEREAIAKTAESLSDCTLYYSEIYKCLYGEYPRNNMPNMEYDKAIIDRIVDLCNTSNMLELPRDKYGEVIHISDEVCDEYDRVAEVTRIEFVDNGNIFIYAYDHETNTTITHFPNHLTHKATPTIEENIKEFNEAVKTTAKFVERLMNECVEAMKKLAEVFNRVGGSDD